MESARNQDLCTNVEVAFQARAALGLGITGIDTRFLVKAVALVPAGTMLGPRAHAHPAKLALALLAGHVVATTVLFNRRLALGALLGVGVEPVGRLRVVGTLLLPELDNLAEDRTVVGSVATPETHVVAAVADNSRDELVEHTGRRLRTLDGILAAGVRAPAKIWRVGDKGGIQQLVVPTGLARTGHTVKRCLFSPCRNVGRDQLVHSLLPHDAVAAALHALDSRTLALALDLACEVLLPAAAAETVSTAEGKRLLLKLGRREVVTADRTVKGLLVGTASLASGAGRKRRD